MGVPLLTRYGERMVARQGAGILRNLELSAWIADSDEAYVAAAVAHASDLSALAQLRDQLRARLLASPLCDAVQFTANLQAAWREMWQMYCDAAQ